METEREGGGTLNSPERLQLGSQRSVQTVMLGCCVFEFKVRWDFPCQLMLSLSLDELEWKQCILRGVICHRRDDGGFP